MDDKHLIARKNNEATERSELNAIENKC